MKIARGLVFEGKGDLKGADYRVTSVYLGRVNFRRLDKLRTGKVVIGRMYTIPTTSFEDICEKVVQEAPEDQAPFDPDTIEFEVPDELPTQLTGGRSSRVRVLG